MSLMQGTNGQHIQVVTNSFAVSQLPSKPYYHYDVVSKQDGNDARELPASRRTTEIIEAMKDRYAGTFKSLVSFDGAKNLFSTDRISNGSFDVQMGQSQSARGRYTVRLARVGKIDPKDIERLITSRGADSPLTPNNTNTIVLTLLQVILSQGPQRQHKFSLHSKSFYIQPGSRPLSGGLVGWKGFFQSVRATAGKIIVNVDTTAAVFYKAIDLLGAALEFLRCREVRELNRLCATPQQFHKLRSFLKGVVVSVPGNRKKRITDIVPRAGHEEFLKDGEKITVAEYWIAHYNQPLRFTDAFGIKLSGGAIFPAEVCNIVPGQRYKKRLSPEDTTAFMQISVSKPDRRISDITDAVKSNLFDYNNSPYMIDAGMRVDPRPLTITGRELPPPRVLYGSNSLNVRDGAWNLRSQTLRQPARITAWAVVVFDTGAGIRERVDGFCVALAQQMQNLGMRIDRSPSKEIGNTQSIEESLKATAMQAVQGMPPTADGNPPKPSIVIVLLPAHGGDEIRKVVKHWGDVVVGIATQCVKAGKYDRENGREQYCANVALKINAKVGGANSFVNPQTMTEFLKSAMVVGCDVTHPSPGVTTRPSVASLVSSYDESATRYRVYLDAQPPRTEIITNIVPMLEAALQSYFRRRGKVLPQTIVIYRDGVSEGEYAKVHEEEIVPIEAHLAKLFQAKAPQVVFIVVGKRHHIRFFPQEGQGDRSGNCRAGLVVDSTIVHSKLMDFYLQSHGGLLGTSRPSHYVVLRNGPQLSADQIQELSYALCHVYAPATRSVSIPAPVYYADKACTRAELQFKRELQYDDETASGEDFNLQRWKDGLLQSSLAAQMYFI